MAHSDAIRYDGRMRTVEFAVYFVGLILLWGSAVRWFFFTNPDAAGFFVAFAAGAYTVGVAAIYRPQWFSSGRQSPRPPARREEDE